MKLGKISLKNAEFKRLVSLAIRKASNVNPDKLEILGYNINEGFGYNSEHIVVNVKIGSDECTVKICLSINEGRIDRITYAEVV